MGLAQEQLLGRSTRTKLPQLQEFTVEDEVRDRDRERKEKGKVHVDCQRIAHESKIEGDKVLLSQEKENKLLTTYEQSPL